MKLSIITINYNDLAGLKNTVNSVINQSWKEYEYVIIDGGSKDGSYEFIKDNAQYFSYFVSEPDKGIYNAMNKGIAKSNGEYLLMLNAGDLLYDNEVLSKIFENTNYTQDIIYGNVDRESKGVVFTESIFPDKLTFGFLRYGMISHQAAFFKRKLHDTVGLYDETIKYGADWHFIIKSICKYNATYLHLNFKMAVCSADGLTCNPSEFDKMFEEKNTVLRNEFPAYVDDYLALDELEKKKINNQIKCFIDNLKQFVKRIIRYKKS